jgi:hypothetical protein
MLFAAGQTLTVTGSGATVPAFASESVMTPALVTLTEPAADAGSYTIRTTAALSVSWTGGQSGAQMLFEGVESTGTSYFVCQWDASAGQGTVPQTVLSGFANQSSAYIIYGQYLTTTFTAGSYSVSLIAVPFTGGSASFE